MKKLVLIAVLLTGFATISNAQKGSLLVYGNLNIASNTDSFAFKTSSYSFNPGIGYQLGDKWTAGLNFAFGGAKSDVGNGPNATTPNAANNNTTSFFNFGPFLRYTYSINNVFSIYGQAEFNYLSGKNTPYATDGGTYKGFGTDFFPAVGINLKNGFALNLSFGGISYQSKTYSGQGYNANPGNISPTSSTNQFAFTFGQGATFGISKNFGLKKHAN